MRRGFLTFECKPCLYSRFSDGAEIEHLKMPPIAASILFNYPLSRHLFQYSDVKWPTWLLGALI